MSLRETPLGSSDSVCAPYLKAKKNQNTSLTTTKKLLLIRIVLILTQETKRTTNPINRAVSSPPAGPSTAIGSPQGYIQISQSKNRKRRHARQWHKMYFKLHDNSSLNDNEDDNNSGNGEGGCLTFSVYTMKRKQQQQQEKGGGGNQ